MNNQLTLFELARMGIANALVPQRVKQLTINRRQQFQLGWPTFRTGQPQWQIIDYPTIVTDGFERNAWIYAPIMYKYRAISTIKINAFVGDPDGQFELAPPDHPLSRVLARPNEAMTGRDLLQFTDVFYNLAGNGYIVVRRERGTGIPIGMFSLRPDRIFIVPLPDGGIAYLYRREGQSLADATWIAPQDMIHPKLPNPRDPLEGFGYGLSPIFPISRSADVDNAATNTLRLFFEEGGVLPGVLTTEMPLDKNTIAGLKEQWQELHGGYWNWAEPAILERGLKYEQLAPPFSEWGFAEIDERNESRILSPFGVPPILLGTRYGLERSTYSNYEQARQAFWEDTFVPELREIEAEYQRVLDFEGAFVKVDFSEVPALIQRNLDRIEAATDLWNMGVPSDFAFSAVVIYTIRNTRYKHRAMKLICRVDKLSQWFRYRAHFQYLTSLCLSVQTWRRRQDPFLVFGLPALLRKMAGSLSGGSPRPFHSPGH